MFSLTASMSLPLALSRKLDAGHPYFMEQQALSTQFFTDLQPLWQYVAQHPDLKAQIQAGMIPQEPTFLKHYTAFISKHGHRGVYESDLARPRYREQPELLLQILINPLPPKPQNEVKTSVWDTLLAPLWKQGAKAVRAREELRYQTMQAFARIRAAMLNLAEYAVREGVFNERDDIWKLNVLEIRRLDIGWKPDEAFWKNRHEEMEENARVRLPDLFRRFDDFYLMESPHLATGFPQELKGMPLTQGYVEGRAWVLNEPKFALPPNFIREKTILIARSVDAGWIPVFGLVAGVVVETGGDLSHGSIILRELGIPAITNVSHATHLIPDGASVILWAEKGKLQVLDR
jgi:pyruvate,water dikinase